MKGLLFFVLVVMVAACGGAAPSTAPASTVHDGDRAPEMATPSNQGTQNTQNTQNTHAQSPQELRMSAARSELDTAESRVNAAMSDCATACRALESMERATEHLCVLDGGTECGRARQRLEAARDRVRTSCGGCR